MNSSILKEGNGEIDVIFKIPVKTVTTTVLLTDEQVLLIVFDPATVKYTEKTTDPVLVTLLKELVPDTSAPDTSFITTVQEPVNSFPSSP